LIASSLDLCMAQRLIRKLCPLCKKPYKPTQEQLEMIGFNKKEAEKITFYEPVGCEECSQTGYKGRMPLFELMEMTPDISKLVMQRADTNLLKAQAVKDGMTLLVQDGMRRIAEGLTSIQEVLSVATAELDLMTPE
jgi:type II secretory ATPase GspE/PulE/Tfp pilus assembly ATPase PilB-like protein